MSNFAWVTLATNDTYSLGALVVAHSLKRVHTVHQLACLVTPGVSPSMKEKLSTIFNLVQEVNLLDSADSANLALLQRPELGVTFTKLHCWRLTQYDKCVFLDADTLVIQNCDELFEREEFSAAPDVGWPDCFNSGVFVFKPSMDTYSSILKFAIENGSFDGGDQGLLNTYFSDWAQKDISKHLPFLYNTSSVATYSYMPAFKQFGENVKILHFIGTMKPWIQKFDSESKHVHVPGGYNHLAKFLQFWWDIFCEDVHPRLSSDMSGIAAALSKLTLGQPKTQEQTEYEEHMRRHYWETGSMDYMGRDKFDNIWAKIQETINGSGSKPSEAGPSPQRRTKSRSRSGTPKRDMKDRSPTPPASDVVPVEKKEGYQQIITTKTPSGKTKIQTKTYYDPALDEECQGDDDVEQMIANDAQSKVEVTQEVVELSDFEVSVAEKTEEVVEVVLQKAVDTVEFMAESIEKVFEVVEEPVIEGATDSFVEESPLMPLANVEESNVMQEKQEVVAILEPIVAAKTSENVEIFHEPIAAVIEKPMVQSIDTVINEIPVKSEVIFEVMTKKEPILKDIESVELISTEKSNIAMSPEPICTELTSKITELDNVIEEIIEKVTFVPTLAVPKKESINEKYIEIVEEACNEKSESQVEGSIKNLEKEENEKLIASAEEILKELEDSIIEKCHEHDFVMVKEPEIKAIEQFCEKTATIPKEVVPEEQVLVKSEKSPEETEQKQDDISPQNKEDFVIVPESTNNTQKDNEFEVIESPKEVASEQQIIEQEIPETVTATSDESAALMTPEDLNGHAPVAAEEETTPLVEPAPDADADAPQPQLQLQEESLAGESRNDVSNMDLMDKIKEIQSSLNYLRDKMNTLESLFKTKDPNSTSPEPKADLDVVLSGFPCNFDVDTVIERLDKIYNFGIHNLANKFKLILDKKSSNEKIYLLLVSFRTLIIKLHFLKEVKCHGELKFLALVKGSGGIRDSVITVNERLNYKNLDIKKHIQSLVNIMP